jgi:hypothetical protein
VLLMTVTSVLKPCFNLEFAALGFTTPERLGGASRSRQHTAWATVAPGLMVVLVQLMSPARLPIHAINCTGSSMKNVRC